MLTNDELRRYNRHIIMSEVGIEGQQKLKNSKVLVIGAGGLGSPILQYLTAAGIGTIGIAEFDVVSESNLQRQILYDTNDIGKPKAQVAAEKLRKQNPNVKFEIFSEGIKKENILSIINDFNVIVDGSDNFPTRYLVSDACILKNKPLVFGAIYKFYGQVSVFNYNNGPSYRCLFPEQPNQSEVPNCSTIGVIGVIPGIIGSIQAGEAIKVILGKEGVLSGRLLQMDTLNFQVDIITFTKDESNFELQELREYGDTCNIDNQNTAVNQIHPNELYIKLNENREHVRIIDIREKHQFNDYSIGGEWVDAVHLLENPTNYTEHDFIVIVCEFGEKSEAVVEFLNDRNFLNFYNLYGGIQEWIKQGFEVKQN